MKKISETLKNMSDNSDFQKRYKKLRDEVLQNEDVKNFLNENRDTLSSDIVERSLMNLYEYKKERNNCRNCPGLAKCNNLIQGYRPNLVITDTTIDLEYEQCSLKITDEQRKKHEKLIDSLYVPRDILEATFTDFHFDKGRIEAAKLAVDFVQNYRSDRDNKALYFHGKFGVGKSYLLGAVANALAEKGVSSMIVYVPEFVREMKSSIGNQTLDEKLDLIKKAPILMLDDIGAESMSSWVRDEVFGTILQYRMLEGLPTFFTSNFNYGELEHHLSYNQRGDEEKIKAARILERIKYLTEASLVTGPNRRN